MNCYVCCQHICYLYTQNYGKRVESILLVYVAKIENQFSLNIEYFIQSFHKRFQQTSNSFAFVRDIDNWPLKHKIKKKNIRFVLQTQRDVSSNQFRYIVRYRYSIQLMNLLIITIRPFLIFLLNSNVPVKHRICEKHVSKQ